jgi:hypothetical protein
VDREVPWNIDAECGENAAELEGKSIALGRLIGPREVGLFDPDAETEDEERAETDLLQPAGHTFAEAACRE